MRKTQYLKTRGARPCARLIASVCAPVVLFGWIGCSSTKHLPLPVPPRPSPITVADGSMVVRTKSPGVSLDSQGSPNVLTISGGHACSITFGNPGTTKTVTGQDWTISSSDKKASVSTRNSGGATIFVTGPDAQVLNSDVSNEGPGYEFGVEQVTFSPATASGAGLPPSLDCKSKLCKITIDYQTSCPSQAAR